MLLVEGLERLGVSQFRLLDQLGFDEIACLPSLWVGQVAFSARTP
jgi:hypothetical protein